MHKLYPFRWLPFLLLGGCMVDDESEQAVKLTGYRPVYASYEEMRQVTTLTPREVKSAGKIYVKDNYLFINEISEGIHVIDNRDPARPRAISFIAIPSNVDIAVKENVLYADNATDLVALDIRNPAEVKLLKRIENAFPYPMFPPETGVEFECVDPEKGVVIRWEQAELTNPQCFR